MQIDLSRNEMLLQARQARHKPNVFLNILIFLAVNFVIQIAVGIVTGVPMVVWMFGNQQYLAAAASGDVQGAVDAVQTMMTDMPEWITVLSLFAAGLETVLAIVYCRCIEGRSLRSMGFVRQGWFKRYAIGFGIGALMLGASAGIAAIFGTMEFSVAPNISVVSLAIFLVGYLVQGMGEEVLVRGYFMTSLANRTHIAVAVGISSVAFSLMHIMNSGITVLALVNLTLFGVFMAVYVLRQGDLWGACALHSAWNFFQGNIFGVQVSGMALQPSLLVGTAAETGALINGGAFGLEGGLAVTIVLLIAIAGALFEPGVRKADAVISDDTQGA